MRQAARSAQEQVAKLKRESTSPTVAISSDGVSDEMGEDFSGIEVFERPRTMVSGAAGEWED